METFWQLRQYLAEFFLEWETYQIRVLEKIETRLMFDNFPPPPENRGVYEIMSKNVVESERPQMTA
jgi:hypothetical protein